MEGFTLPFPAFLSAFTSENETRKLNPKADFYVEREKPRNDSTLLILYGTLKDVLLF